MITDNYTIFVSRSGKYDRTAVLLVDTQSSETAAKAKTWAKANGWKVCREIFPGEVVEAPNFGNTIK